MKETKPCVICEKTIVRSINNNDFGWKIKKYCSLECQESGWYISYLKKRGFTVTKDETNTNNKL